MKEVWKDINGYEGLYQVSNLGRVKSFPRNGTGKGVKILKPYGNGRGYLRVGLLKECKKTDYLLHRLVAEAFIPNPNNLPQVNHKDEDKRNNYVFVNQDGSIDADKSNLEWCSCEYNLNYGTRNQRASKIVVMFSLTGERIKEFKSRAEAEIETGVKGTNITYCCNGRRKTAGGFVWKYKNIA